MRVCVCIDMEEETEKKWEHKLLIKQTETKLLIS